MTQDTRKDRRVKIVSLNVRYKSATVDEFIDNHALDVSRGGIYIKTNNPFSAGTLLKFEIRLLSDQAVITGVGRVVWKRDAGQGDQERPPGMGVKFIKVDDPSRALIDKLVNTRADAGKAFESEPEAARTSVGSQKRSASPAAVHAATRVGSPSSPAIRKGTIVGLGTAAAAGAGQRLSSNPPAAFSPPASTPPLGTPAARESLPPGARVRTGADTPGATVRPGADYAEGAEPPDGPRSGGGGPASEPPLGSGVADPMFPRRVSVTSSPPLGEATVMRQATELLEEALREAGGTLEDVGTNPLFSGGARTPEGSSLGADPAARESAVPSPRRGRSLAPSDPLRSASGDPGSNPRAQTGVLVPGSLHRSGPPSDALALVREPTEGSNLALVGRSSARSGFPSRPLADDRNPEGAPSRRKGSVAKWLLLAAAAVAAASIVAFREQILGRLNGSATNVISVTAPAPVVRAHAAPGTPVAAAPEPASPSPSVGPAAAERGAASAALAIEAPSTAARSMSPPRVAPPAFVPRPAPPPAAYAAPRTRQAPAAPPEPRASESPETPNIPTVSKESDKTPPQTPPASSTPITAAPSGAAAGSAESKSRSSSRSLDDNPY